MVERAKKPPKSSDQPCDAPGCPRDAVVKGLCWSHYRRLRRQVDPLKPTRPTLNVELAAKPIPPTKLRKEVHEYLEKMAAVEGVSLYAMVQRALDEWYASRRPGASQKPSQK